MVRLQGDCCIARRLHLSKMWMLAPTPCTSSRARTHNRTNVQLWCASPHECALLQQATSRFVPIYFVRYLSGLTPPPIRLTNQPKTAATTPQEPATASSKTDPESERHHPRGLGLGARRRAPKDGSTRHAAAPHTRHRRAGPATKTDTPGTTARQQSRRTTTTSTPTLTHTQRRLL